ncbi:MAG: DUF1648 domain-containing protein [Saprospiraceae bacterium]
MTSLSKSDRPKIILSLQPLDYALEILAAFALLALLGVAALHYGQLPEQIPAHFGADGRPDGFGSKTAFWILPLLGFAIYVFMTLINRRPERFNYTVNITPENAERQYCMATRLIRTIKAVALVLFAFLVWRTIGVAQGEADGLGVWALPLVLVATLGTAFFYILKSTAQK